MKQNYDTIPDFTQKLQVPEDVHRRILETCRSLPDRNPVKNRRRPLKIAFGSAASLAAAFMLLLGVNAANPVFAEGLPLIGGLFKQMNGDKKIAVGSNIDTYGKIEAVQGVAAVSGEMALTLTEAYSDGVYVHCAFTLQTPADVVGKYEYISVPVLASVNGETAPGANGAYNYLSLNALGDGYAGTLAVKLPNTVENGAKLALSYTIESALGIKALEEYTEEPLVCSFTGAYEVTADTTANEKIGDFTGSGEAKVLSVERTPSETKIVYALPYWGEIGHATFWGPRLFLEDGTEVYRNEADLPNIPATAGTLTGTVLFDGLPKDADTVILRFGHEYQLFDSGLALVNGQMQKKPPKIMAEITVDLKNRTYTPSSTFLQAGMIDYKALVYTDYSKISWSLIFSDLFKNPEYKNALTVDTVFDMDGLFQNGFTPESLSITKEGAVEMNWLMRGDDYRAVTLRLTKDGEEIAGTASTKADHFINRNLALCRGDTDLLYKEWEESGYSEGEIASLEASIQKHVPGQTYYNFQFSLLDGATVNFMDTVTATLTDTETGETLFTKDILLSNKEIYD